MSRGAKTLGWTLLVFILVAAFEVFSYLAIKNLSFLRYYAYSQPEVTEDQFNDYLADRHPVLGWPDKTWFGSILDEDGARKSPANLTVSNPVPCASVYGDSFAFGDEATDEQAWANVLADILDCRVNNFGIGGYGLDQALLRFEGHLEQDKDLGDTIIFTVFPDDLNRNMNQWRYLLGSGPLSFKPAFYVAGDEVQLEPQFNGTFEDWRKIAADPKSTLVAEQYAPNSDGFRRPVPFKFPYSVAFVKIGWGLVETLRGDAPKGYGFLNNYPGYFDSGAGMSAEKIQVASYIVERFQSTCDAAQKTCVVILLPDPELVYQATLGAHDFEPWLPDSISTAQYLDATDMFSGLDDICSSLTNPDACNGHFNANGYERLARFVAERVAW